MTMKYHEKGELLQSLDPDNLKYEESRCLYMACKKSNDFKILELRQFDNEIGAARDGIVVDCCDGTVGSRNTVGIKNRERLLITYSKSRNRYDVQALRVDFPLTLHQNRQSISESEPASLCLYLDPWYEIERTWTPEKYLQRILWWLERTSNGTWHENDQQLEPLYLAPWKTVILPANFKENILKQELWKITPIKEPHNIYHRATKIEDTQDENICYQIIVLSVAPVFASQIESHPKNLGELSDQLAKYGSKFKDRLTKTIKKIPTQSQTKAQKIYLILEIPMKRAANSPVERIDLIGFDLETSLDELRKAFGVFNDVFLDFFDHENSQSESWKKLSIHAVSTIKPTLKTENAREASGIQDKNSDFPGVLAGVGALGSCMAEIWTRIGWGKWSFVDDDLLEPHNLIRHIGMDYQIGVKKVDVIANMVNLIWPTIPKPNAINEKITNFDHEEVKQVISAASLLVDATTTLEVPRDLSDKDKGPRIASTFLSPSGESSVLFLEDKKRSIRVNSLEAQYYRAILNSKWGNSHLTKDNKHYRIGGGCRDLSHTLSLEVVQLHAATLAKQIRLLSAKSAAKILVWSANEKTGALVSHNIPVEKSIVKKKDEWRIIWDEGLAKKLQKLRIESLPKETGGIILGYIDQKQKAVYVVDLLIAPCDSTATSNSFIRGQDNLEREVKSVKFKTAGIVSYIGEWHSHPKNASTSPSYADCKLLDELSKRLASEGSPFLMIIVGKGKFSVCLKKSDA